MIRLLLLVAAAAVVAYAVWRWRKDRREHTLARARSAFFLVTPTPEGRGPSSDRMRSISVGEDRLRMRVPDEWDEQPATNAYRALASSSRVFQALVRQRTQAGVTSSALAEELQESPAGREGRIDVLPDDRVLLKHVRSGASDGAVGLTYCWTLAAVPRPDTVVSLELTLAVPLEATDAITLDDLALLEREVRAAKLSSHDTNRG